MGIGFRMRIHGEYDYPKEGWHLILEPGEDSAESVVSLKMVCEWQGNDVQCQMLEFNGHGALVWDNLVGSGGGTYFVKKQKSLPFQAERLAETESRRS